MASLSATCPIDSSIIDPIRNSCVTTGNTIQQAHLSLLSVHLKFSKISNCSYAQYKSSLGPIIEVSVN